MFAAYNPTSANVVTDRYSGRSKGFGFVEVDDAQGEKAIAELNGTQAGGRSLVVSVARPREERPFNKDFSRGGRDGGRDGGRGGHDRRDF